MRRWMSIITLAALAFALVAGWGIGRLAGGGDDELVIRPLVTLTSTTAAEGLEPTSLPISTPAATEATIAATPRTAEASPTTAQPATPPVTASPDSP